MRAGMLSAALTLLLLGSLAACGTSGSGQPGEDSAASERRTLVEDAENAAMPPTRPLPYDQQPGESYMESTQNAQNHTNDRNTLQDDWRTEGAEIQQDVAKAGRDTANGIRDIGRTIENGVERATN